MKKQKNKLTIHPTKKPHTFFLKYKISPSSQPYYEKRHEYKRVAQEFVNEVNEMGLRANLKKRYTFYSYFYITFKSKYDVVAFKLKWVL